MVQVPANHFSRLKKWPLYPGTGAGHQVKEEEQYRRHPIQVITAGTFSRQVHEHSIKSQLRRPRNPSNCVCITPSQPNISVPQDKHFVPSVFLTDVMSLDPKINELPHVVLNANSDLVSITKTWLQKHTPDSTVTIPRCVCILKSTNSLHHFRRFHC